MARFQAVACPDPEVLSAFSRGRLEPSRRSEIEAHLDECEGCGQVVAGLVRIYATADRSEEAVEPPAGHEQTLVDDDVAAPEDRDGRGSRLEPGARLDRYHILEAVGAGGMGVVYAAYDADLDRKVALKVLREHSSDDRAQRRLLREAQAMARLSHPNVITVHEVRMVEQQVFISMEFVEGGTLEQWMKREEPDQDRILAMFRDIGRGLVAAHAAGLVHRDVKPDNVLIGADERPRVTDFGLARPSDDDLEASGGSKDSQRLSGPTDPGLVQLVEQQPLDDALTRTGALVGTPAYMAPEQFRRQPTTAASDQFSFCVALYEALYGQRPFAGRALPELAANVLNESIIEPKDDRGVPRWLRQVLRRGLSLDPKDRWASMEELVAQLEPSPPRTRRRLLVAGVAAAMAVGGTIATRGLSSADPCDRGRRSMNELWAAGARGQVADALSQGSGKYAEDTAQLAVQRIDEYVEAWTVSHRGACEGYQRGELSDEALDLRGACLDDRRRDLSALVGVLAQADPAVRRHAVEAVEGLPAVAPCEDIAALRARVPPPRDPQVLVRVQKIEQELARAHALYNAGQYDAGFVVADQATQSARAVGHSPLLADALRSRARLERSRRRSPEAATDLLEAWQVALSAGDDTVAAEAVVAYVLVVGYELQRFDEAEARIGDARAMLERVRRYDATRADQLEGELAHARGQIEMRNHRYDMAIELFRLAQQRAEARFGPNGLGTSAALGSIANAHMAKKRWQDSMDANQRVLDIKIEHLGPTHPEVGHALNNVGLNLKHLRRYDESIETFLRAREVLAYSLAPDHPSFSMIDINLAEVYFNRDRFADAVDRYDPHLAGIQAADIEHGYTLRRVSHYAYALARVGRNDDARSVAQVVLERSRDLQDPGTARLMTALLAFVDVDEGKHERALSRIEGLSVHDPVQDVVEAEALLTKGRALVGRGAPGDREQAEALLADVRAIDDSVIAPSTEDIDLLVKALAADDAPPATP